MGLVAWASRALPAPVAAPARNLFRATHRGLEKLPDRAPLGDPWPVALYVVYRARNAANVQALVDQLPAGSRVALHALDQPTESLRPFTVSEGPGLRIPLLQSLIDHSPPGPERAVIIADDDIRFRRGRGLNRFVRVARAAGFDLSQPSHVRSGERTFPVNGTSYHSVARLVPFVEVGPMVLFSPAVVPAVLPFPADARMGWGVDVLWIPLRGRGFRMGVVDATPVQHLGPVAVSYDTDAEWAYLRRCLDELHLHCIHDATSGPQQVWARWQPHPPWLTNGLQEDDHAEGQP